MKRVIAFSATVGLAIGAIAPGVSAGSATASTTPATSAEYIVTLRAPADPTLAAADLAKLTQGRVTHVYRHAMRGFAVSILDARAGVLVADRRVASIERSVEFTRTFDPNAEQRVTSALNRLDGELSSTVGGDGHSTVDIAVAIVDDGVDATHPELNVVGGTSCVGGDATHPGPDQHHGTMVAGFVAARDNAVGIVGTAPGARIFSAQVFGASGTSPTATIVCGVDAVTATRTDADPTNDISVANLSLAGPGQDDGSCLETRRALHRAICAAEKVGVTFVVAASNEGQNFGKREPASYNDVLTVTATTETDGVPGGLGPAPGCVVDGRATKNDRYRDDVVADFSDFATDVADRSHTVAAPGVCMTGVLPQALCADQVPVPAGCYGVGTGTSFATPWAAGTVALCIAQGPCAGLTPGQVVARIVADAQAYTQGHPEYGYAGDPLHPITGRYYGPLIRAGTY